MNLYMLIHTKSGACHKIKGDAIQEDNEQKLQEIVNGFYKEFSFENVDLMKINNFLINIKEIEAIEFIIE